MTVARPVPWSVANWPIEVPKTEVGFRYFRIKATGPNADPKQPANMRCRGLGRIPPQETPIASPRAAMVGYKTVLLSAKIER